MNNKQPISEVAAMTETDKLIRIRERIEEFHIENMDWQRVLEDKWALASLAQGR